MDGTLLNTLETIAHCGNKTLSHFSLPPLDTAEFTNYIGHGADALIKGIFARSGADAAVFDEFYDFYMNVYRNIGTYKTQPYDGVIEMLDGLNAHGIKTAVLTNKPHEIACEVCAEFFGDRLLTVCGQKKGFPVKPDAAALIGILRDFDVDNESCVYCGDSEVDIQTGKNAHVFTVGAAWGFYGDTRFSGADAIIYKPCDIMKFFKKE